MYKEEFSIDFNGDLLGIYALPTDTVRTVLLESLKEMGLPTDNLEKWEVYLSSGNVIGLDESLHLFLREEIFIGRLDA